MGGPIKVVCHDHEHAIHGTLRNADDAGCELISLLKTAGPVFAKKSRVLLSVTRDNSTVCENVYARLTGVIRDDGKWVYRIRWQKKPQLLDDEQDQKAA